MKRPPIAKEENSPALEVLKGEQDETRTILYDKSITDEEANKAVKAFNEKWIKAGGYEGSCFVLRSDLPAFMRAK